MDPIEIKKSEMELYVVEWDSYNNWLYLTVKVVRLFRKKGVVIRKKYKNMITCPAIEQALPDSLQQGQLRRALSKWDEIDKAVRSALKHPPRNKVEF